MVSYKFCVWFSLAQLSTEIARVLFSSHFLEKKPSLISSSCFSYLFNVSTRIFFNLMLSPSHVSQNIPAILKPSL